MEAISRLFRPVAPRAVAPLQPRAADATQVSFKAITYNILADKYSYAQSYCPSEHLAWSSRWPRIQAEVQAYDADLMFFQEVERPVYEEQLKPWLDGQYDSLYNPRRLPQGVPGPEEGVSLHWKRSTFSLLDSFAFRFADLAPSVVPSGAADDPAAVPLMRVLMRREEGAVAALLQHRVTGEQLLATSTHIFWDPNYPDVKLLQAAALCYGIASFLDSKCGTGAVGRVPVIIGGDFNSLPGKWESDPFDAVTPGQCLVSGVYELLTKGRVGPEHHEHPIKRSCSSGGGSGGNHHHHQQQQQQDGDGSGGTAGMARHVFGTSGLRLQSMHVQALGREPPLTTRTTTFHGVLDYLFLSPGCFEVLSTLEMPYPWHPQAAGADGGSGSGSGQQRREGDAAPVPPSAVPLAALAPAPNAVFPSDHLAVGAELVLLRA